MALPRTVYADLLGKPYAECGGDPAVGLSCSGACLELLRRLGLEPPDGALPLGPDTYQAGLADSGSSDSPWRRIGGAAEAAKLPGDLVLVRIPDGRHHVLVSLGDRFFLSADPKRGVHALRMRGVLGEVLGVYRLRRP